MAQRSFSCPDCGGDVYIPDHYFKAGILCGHCGAAVNRLDGELYEGDAQDLDTAATEPPPAEPTASRAGTRARPLAVIVVIAVVLVVGAVGAMLIFGPGEEEEPGQDFEWREYESEGGGFSASFPGSPREYTEDVMTATGTTPAHKLRARVSGVTFEAAYFDAPEVNEAAAQREISELMVVLAEDHGGSAENGDSVQVSGVPGLRAEVPAGGGGTSNLLVVRAPYRFILASVEGSTGGLEDAVDRFLQSIKLVPEVADPDPMRLNVMIPTYFHAGQEREPYIEIEGGAGPFNIRTSPRLPSGWRGVVEGRRYVLKGSPDAAGNTLVTFTVTDAYGQSAEVQQNLRVVPEAGPVEFGDSFVTGGMVGVPYQAWVRIENHLPGLVRYEVTWNDTNLPDRLIAIHLTEPEEIEEAGLEPGHDYVIVTGDPLRPGAGACTITLAAEAPNETVKTPEEHTFTFEVSIDRNDD